MTSVLTTKKQCTGKGKTTRKKRGGRKEKKKKPCHGDEPNKQKRVAKNIVPQKNGRPEHNGGKAKTKVGRREKPRTRQNQEMRGQKRKPSMKKKNHSGG